jgi:GNAT superfamily N-acetyltransferase
MENMGVDKLDAIVCRPALAKDTKAVMELSSHIWEGGDYIPHVWDEWLADPQGLLGVAEYKGRIAGVFKLTKFQEEEWYMEGLRVHPDFQGMGVASHIHKYVIDTWRKMGRGIIRLTTGSYNVKVHRMCEETGFQRIAEFIPYRAPVLLDGTSDFSLLNSDEAHAALEFVMASPAHKLSSGLINLGWVYADPQLKHVQEAVREKHAWWWRGGQGFISIWEDDEDGDNSPAIQLVACPMSDLQHLLCDYRLLMGKAGYKTAGWVAPNQPQVISAIKQAGFDQSWDMSLYIYEQRE